MAPTNSTELMRWTDAPQPGRSAHEWPYPTEHVKYLISGELADRVRQRLGVPQDTPVIMTEHQHSGGYSEYTQETDYEHEITCGSHEIHLGTVYWGNGLEALLKWLDRVDEGL